MKYSVTAKLRKYSHHSFELLTTLGFTIFIRDETSGAISVIDDYRKTAKIISIEDIAPKIICIYNGDKLPSNCIIALLEDDPNISSYTIEKRDV